MVKLGLDVKFHIHIEKRETLFPELFRCPLKYGKTGLISYYHSNR